MELPNRLPKYSAATYYCISGMPTHKLLLCYYVPLCCRGIWFALSAIWLWWQRAAGGSWAQRWLLIAGLAGACYMTYCSMHEGRPTQHSVAGRGFVRGIWQRAPPDQEETVNDVKRKCKNLEGFLAGAELFYILFSRTSLQAPLLLHLSRCSS